MNGLIALVGSGEYLLVMNEVDRFLLGNSGASGRLPRVVCLPTAAGQEGKASWGRWMRMGMEHFSRLGAQVVSLPVIDRPSANDPGHASQVEAADLIYFSGGNPLYLHETLNGSLVWEAAQKAWLRGAVYAGCSAGAMILAQEMPNFRAAALTNVPAFGLLDARMVLPHFDRWKILRCAMLAHLRLRLKSGEYTLGVDEETALVGRLGEPEWRVLGRQTVSVITKSTLRAYKSGQTVVL